MKNYIGYYMSNCTIVSFGKHDNNKKGQKVK